MSGPHTREVAEGVWQIVLPWTNAWLLAKGGEATLIDSGTRWDRKAILDALHRACPGGFHLRSVLLTHAHCDHAGNAAYCAGIHGAALGCHAAEEAFIATTRTYVPRGIRAVSLSGALFLAGELLFPVKRRRPDILLKEGDILPTPIGPLRVIETPGHTPGHVSYFHEERGWLFSGDALINIIPWLRKTGLSLPLAVFTSDMEASKRSAWKIADLGPTSLFPGHGPPLLDNTAESIRALMARHPRAGL